MTSPYVYDIGAQQVLSAVSTLKEKATTQSSFTSTDLIPLLDALEKSMEDLKIIARHVAKK